jgi:hypothetical protein
MVELSLLYFVDMFEMVILGAKGLDHMGHGFMVIEVFFGMVAGRLISDFGERLFFG